jgi:Fur family peroxide stress response transcriptional regulator
MIEIKKLLEEKGLRPTIHRIVILSYLMETKDHPTIDDIYNYVMKKIPTISKATVYNTVNSLVENNLIEQLNLPDGVRFDCMDSEHSHFYCRVCKRLYDIDITLPDVPEFYEGHKIEKVKYLFIGVCKDCLKKQKEERK